MKLIQKVVMILVGALFIFSGAIKINDPVGTAIKLEEYFEVFAVDFSPFFHHFIPVALPLSVFLCAFEIILGVALIANYRRQWIIYSLLAMIVFFTILTFYSAYFNKVTDCGCFGAVIKLTPWQSFGKDVVLLVLLLFLLFTKKTIENITNIIGMSATVFATFVSFGVGIYAIRHLPIIDALAYKVGNHIPTQMKGQEPCQYKYIMKKNNERFEFDNYPTDTSYQYDTMLIVNSERCLPKITDYKVWNDSADFTEESFKGKKLIMVVSDVSKTEAKSFGVMNELFKQLGGDIQVVAFTNSPRDFEVLRHEYQLAIPHYATDGVVLKTMIRSNPGLFLMKDGMVKGKWHYNDVPSVEEVKKTLQ